MLQEYYPIRRNGNMIVILTRYVRPAYFCNTAVEAPRWATGALLPDAGSGTCIARHLFPVLR